MTTDAFLPLGSVVSLKDEDKTFMIISRGVARLESGRKQYYDYRLCLYPEGHTNSLSIYCNKESIDEVLHLGFENEDDRSYVGLLTDVLNGTELPKFNFETQTAGVW